MNQNLKKSATRIAGMLGIGRITTQKDSGVVQEIQYQTPLEVASAPRLSDFGFSSGLPAGSDVLIAFLGGDRSSPVVIASNHQSFRYTGLKPGETVVYNQQGMNIHLTEEGIFIDAKGKDVEINNARNITATATEQVKLVNDKHCWQCVGCCNSGFAGYHRRCDRRRHFRKCRCWHHSYTGC